MFSTLHKTNFKFSVTFILLSANAFDLDKPKILSFGNELRRILFNSVLMVVAFGAQDHWFESFQDLIFLPCIYSFVSLLQTL